MDPRGFLTTNLPLDLGILSWTLAQVSKVILHLALNRRLDLRLVMSSGGMPSSHSAFVCALSVAMLEIYGLRSPHFALSAALALVVMYDACNVRRAAGEQAKILNYIMEHWTEMSPALVGEELKELLGHTPLQVAAGAILGCAVGAAATLFLP